MADNEIKNGIVELIGDCDRLNVVSVTCDELAKGLRISRTATLQALQELIVEGRVEYARKNPRSAQPHSQPAAEALKQ